MRDGEIGEAFNPNIRAPYYLQHNPCVEEIPMNTLSDRLITVFSALGGLALLATVPAVFAGFFHAS